MLYGGTWDWYSRKQHIMRELFWAVVRTVTGPGETQRGLLQRRTNRTRRCLRRWRGLQSSAWVSSTRRGSPTQRGPLQRRTNRTHRCLRRQQGLQSGAWVSSTRRSSPKQRGPLRECLKLIQQQQGNSSHDVNMEEVAALSKSGLRQRWQLDEDHGWP